MTPADRLTMPLEARLAWLAAHRYQPRTTEPDLYRRLEHGRLSQACPDCGTAEAAGFYCTACYLPTGPDDWAANPTGSASRKAHERARQPAPSRLGAGEAPETVSQPIQAVAGPVDAHPTICEAQQPRRGRPADSSPCRAPWPDACGVASGRSQSR